MRITRDEARVFFEHPSQQKEGVKPENLPDEGMFYYAQGPFCGAFHQAPWHDTWFGHYGVKPSGWGNLVKPARAVIRAFAKDTGARLIVGWTPEGNRAAVAFARRLGFRENGRMHTPKGTLIMQEYDPWE